MSGRIIAFPKDGNLYTEKLYVEVEKQGTLALAGVWSLPWMRKNLRPGDLVHIHWPSFLYFEPRSRPRTGLRLVKMYVLLSFCRFRGATVVWTAHNLYPHDDGPNSVLHRIGRRIMVAFADHVCVHGASAATIVGREFHVAESRMRIGHHPHWIDCYPNSVSRAESRARVGVGGGDYVYLFIGRCRPYKGLESLIEAFRAAPQPSRLIIAGKFSSAGYQQEIAALIQDVRRVQLIARRIPDDEIQSFMNAADCVVLPYRAVLTSGAALLALSFGRPVVVPDLGSIRDHVDPRCGVLYAPDQPNALATALIDVRARQFDAAGIIDHVRHFTWARLAADLLEFV